MHMQCRCAWGSSWEDMYTSSPSTPSCALSSLILSIADPETRWKGSAINDSPDTPFQRASAVHSTIARGVCGEPI